MAGAPDVERLLADLDGCICSFGVASAARSANDAPLRALDDATLRAVPRLTSAAMALATAATPQDKARILGRVDTLALAVDARMQTMNSHLAQLAAGRRAVRGYAPGGGRR